MSSIFMMLLTVSVASLMAEEDTSNGCTTFSSRISVMVPWMKKTAEEPILITIRSPLYTVEPPIKDPLR